MSTIRKWLARRAGVAWRAMQRAVLRGRIAQLEQMLMQPDLMLYHQAEPRAIYEARLAELRCELYSLEAMP